jgi:hypothetical protein
MDMMKFRASQVLNVMDILLTSMGDVYAVLNYMTGDDLYTHQLPRAARWVRPIIEEQHPWIVEELAYVNKFPWDAMSRDHAKVVADLIATGVDDFYGEVTLTPRPDLWSRQDPISELLEMTDKPVLVAVAP